jgi:DNA polymerase III subunit beta
VRFRSECELLAEATVTAGRAAASRPVGPAATGGILLQVAADQLTVTGTDLDLRIEVSLPVTADADGRVVVPARLAADVFRSIGTGKVVVELEDEVVRIAADRASFELRTLTSPDDFPRAAASAAAPVTLSAAVFGEAVRQVERAASTDDNRLPLTGVLMAAEESGLRLVATDSYRLAVRELPEAVVLSAGQRVLIPARALRELARLLPGEGDVTLRLGEKEATFEVGAKRLSTRLLDDRFPNYAQLIPTAHPSRLRVGREPLLEALKRLRPILQGAANPNVRLQLDTEAVELLAVDAERGQASDSVLASYDGEPLTVAFNPEFLAQGVEAAVGDEVVLELLDAMKPVVIRSAEKADFTYLLMPVRVA